MGTNVRIGVPVNSYTLSHSDQIVATIAKLPASTFGTHYTKEVALVIARHMNKAPRAGLPVSTYVPSLKLSAAPLAQSAMRCVVWKILVSSRPNTVSTTR